ncbi:unnamed protein product [Trifolium pratense]|uniref:Uncharacterized protein n=1 Tax=Trifolium pratense TaxID=57577 RepID=A0ACB0LJ01_TRIPR|nr:unnamed protein product [Trifolium pratense]
MHLGDPYCSRRCNLQVETISHVMRDCPIARVDNDGINWNALWAIACHCLWLSRNRETHDSNVSRPPEALGVNPEV